MACKWAPTHLCRNLRLRPRGNATDKCTRDDPSRTTSARSERNLPSGRSHRQLVRLQLKNKSVELIEEKIAHQTRSMILMKVNLSGRWWDCSGRLSASVTSAATTATLSSPDDSSGPTIRTVHLLPKSGTVSSQRRHPALRNCHTPARPAAPKMCRRLERHQRCGSTLKRDAPLIAVKWVKSKKCRCVHPVTSQLLLLPAPTSTSDF